MQTFFVFFKDLDIVVCEAERSQPYGGYQHQYHIYIMQFTQQQTRNQDGYNDDDTSHAWYAYFVDTERVGLGVTLCFRDLLLFKQIDEFVSPYT